MSFDDGWSAIHLEMPSRVPRTEYSAAFHWPLVREVTGLTVGPDSPAEEQAAASDAFMAAWNYDFNWTIHFGPGILEACRTHMGHAAYADGGGDQSNEVSCPFHSPEEVLAFDPASVYGRPEQATLISEIEARYAEQCRRVPGAVNMTGIYVTLISGLVEIFGWDMMLMAMGTDPDGFGQVANRYAAWVMDYFEAMAASSVPVVMVHDDIVWTSGPFAHPDWYRRYVFPNYHTLFEPLRAAGKKIAYTSDGTYTMFLDDIAAAGADGFILEPTTDMAYLAERYGRSHFFIGNADTRILLTGSESQIRAEVQRCMDIGKDCPGFFMAVGNHIPPNTPVDSALYYNAVYEELSPR